MTIFRFEKGISAGCLLAVCGCGTPKAPEPKACSEQALPYDIAQYKSSLVSPDELAKCLTDQVIRLDPAGGPAEDVASAAVSGCQTQLALFENEAGIQGFERGEINTAIATEKVRSEARRYALSRVVQVRAGQCEQRAKP
jgi:hypothetical protein